MHFVFKYYISKVEGDGGSIPSIILLMQGFGWGVQNLDKCADVILERSLSQIFDIQKLSFSSDTCFTMN